MRTRLVHRDRQEMSVYQLAVAEGGPKLKAAASADPPPDGFPILPAGPGPLSMTLADGRSSMRTVAESMAGFAARLSGQLGLPVVDATHLTGRYDFVLHWVAEGPGYPTGDQAGPTIFTALEDQLGLRLRKGKARVNVLVVDRLEKTPTEN